MTAKAAHPVVPDNGVRFDLATLPPKQLLRRLSIPNHGDTP